MDGLTSGERVLLFAILGLFAAAGLVQMGTRKAPTPDAPRAGTDNVAIERVSEPTDEVTSTQTESAASTVVSNGLAQAEGETKAAEI
jgi:hypothetical protein